MSLVSCTVAGEPSCASAPDCHAQKRSKTAIFLEKRKQKAPRKFGQKKREKFPHDIRENELVGYELV